MWISQKGTPTEHPPSSPLAKFLVVTADALLGIKPLKKSRKPDTRLQRRFQQIEKLDTKDKRQVMRLLDTFIENARLKRKVG